MVTDIKYFTMYFSLRQIFLLLFGMKPSSVNVRNTGVTQPMKFKSVKMKFG